MRPRHESMEGIMNGWYTHYFLHSLGNISAIGELSNFVLLWDGGSFDAHDVRGGESIIGA